MPAYVTQSQLVDRKGTKLLLDLTDRAMPRSGLIDAVVVTRAITDACALIDGYLSDRYQLPFSIVPASLIPIATDVAIYFLHGQLSTEKVRLDYQDALKALHDIQAGTFKLDVAGTEPQGKANLGQAQTNSPARPITNGPIRGFV